MCVAPPCGGCYLSVSLGTISASRAVLIYFVSPVLWWLSVEKPLLTERGRLAFSYTLLSLPNFPARKSFTEAILILQNEALCLRIFLLKTFFLYKIKERANIISLIELVDGTSYVPCLKLTKYGLCAVSSFLASVLPFQRSTRCLCHNLKVPARSWHFPDRLGIRRAK